jgi:glycosyltransferase involved in cell wall biosynthesis
MTEPAPAETGEDSGGRPESIAYVTAIFPTFAWFIESEVDRLRLRGVRVRVLTLRGVEAPLHAEHQALIPLTTSVGSPWSPAAWRAVARWLLRRPGVFLGEALRMIWASRRSLYALVGHLGYLPAAARVAGIVADERIEHVHGAWAHFPASVAYLASRLTGCGFSLAGHAGADLFRTRAFLVEKLYAADFAVACVRANADLLRGLAPGKHVECIYHGVDLGSFDGTGRRRDPEPLLLAGGRLSPEKGLDLAIRALARVSPELRPRLVLFGSGPARPALEQLARRLGVGERVEFTGRLTRSELQALMRRAWLLLSPCRVLSRGRRDGIPNVVTEALAMGVPCVGTRVGGIEEVVVTGETGALCEPEDVDGLVRALDALLRSPAALDRMGAIGQQRARRDLDAARQFERLFELFCEAHAGREPRRAAT